MKNISEISIDGSIILVVITMVILMSVLILSLNLSPQKMHLLGRLLKRAMMLWKK
jgi:hypothetical protein